MTDKLTQAWQGALGKIMSWVAPILLGALLTMLLNFSGDRKQVEMNTVDIAAIRLEMKELQNNSASNKRVDDLTAEVRSNYRDLKNGNDEILRLLIQFQRNK